MAAPDGPQQLLPGLNQFLRDTRKIGPEFNKALRAGNVKVAQNVVNRATQNAGTPGERAVARGLRARPDRVPKIDVSTSRAFTSSSRPNPRRTQASKVKIIDMWFGTEFGGGKYQQGNKTNRVTSRGNTVRKGGGYTSQFRPHLGTTGYFFYPVVRREGPNMVREYAAVIDEVRRNFERGRL